ncbi:ABC transporter ATP-binding protein [Haloplanus ruber]|uniref:ABC-type D-xylose/L-arabinose transporter n=1 Tax=Haloplanus ruber TaxID=869892 RepID=A0ABD6CTN6_9EURY|nr:ABC transporter ATP-binding protein [Haloplanus ruber]
MTTIELDTVRKEFGDDIVAVDDVSLTIEDGELVVLVGPSGSGKSTTLRMIAGLEAPTSGDVRIDGIRVNDVQPQNRDIAMVFQSFALYPHRTVRGNISFPLEARDVPDAEVDGRVEEAAAMLDITELLDRKPANLSGGQQQRVALGRALVRDPQAFLMDEPLANLDAKLRKEMRTEVVRLQQNLGVTMVHVTHNQEEAMTMGDRVAVMNEGKIQQLAPPKEVYQRPANRFVAEFIGSPSMNLLTGSLSDGTFHADAGDVSVRVPDGLADASTATPLTLGVRPESVQIVDSPDEYTFEATVDVVELMGNVQIVHIVLDDTEFLAEIDPDLAVEQGDTLSLRLPPEKIDLFDGVRPESPRIERPADHEPSVGGTVVTEE